MLRLRLLLGILTVVWLGLPGDCWAIVGLAEWTIKTPGGYLICSADPFEATHGMCLREDDEIPGLIEHDVKVHVSHLRRWRFYEGFIAGESKGVYVLFREQDAHIETFPDEAELEQALSQMDAGEPLCDWLGAGDGWAIAWGQVFGIQYTLQTWLQPFEAFASQSRFDAFRDRVTDPLETPESLLIYCLKELGFTTGFSTLETIELFHPDYDAEELSSRVVALCGREVEAEVVENPLVAFLIASGGQFPADPEIEQRWADYRLLVERYRLRLCEEILQRSLPSRGD